MKTYKFILILEDFKISYIVVLKILSNVLRFFGWKENNLKISCYLYILSSSNFVFFEGWVVVLEVLLICFLFGKMINYLSILVKEYKWFLFIVKISLFICK